MQKLLLFSIKNKIKGVIMKKILKKNIRNKKDTIQPQKKDNYPWLNGKKKTLDFDEIINIEEFLED